MAVGLRINLTIRLYGVFRIDRFKEQRLEFAVGVRVADIVEYLQLNRQLLGIVLINDKHQDMNAELSDGDTLALLPILEGG